MGAEMKFFWFELIKTMSSVIARYSFLPWMRQGIGSFIQEPDELGHQGGGQSGVLRATVPIDLTLNRGQGNPFSFTQNVEVIGPGEILGIDKRNIVRMHPEPNTPTFTPNYLPFIEFYQDTFCWDYTPASHNGGLGGGNERRLRPWVALMVLKEDEFTFFENPSGPLPYFQLLVQHSEAFPPETQSWAWAHVHVNVDLSTTQGGQDVNHLPQGMARLEAKMQSNPDFAVSRLVCPRRLEANTRYVAVVIPAFETGRLAGLGIDPVTISGVETQMASWDVGNGHAQLPQEALPNYFPIYHSWPFQTGPNGDFESLVRRLQSRALDPTLGFRDMDVQADSPFGISGITTPPTLPFGGALKLPVPPVDPWSGSSRTDWERDLAELLNSNEHIKYSDPNFISFVQNPFTNTPVDTDPVVTPPLYGRYHSIVRTLEPELGGAFPSTPANQWVRELNLDPRNRAAAGLGSLIVQENQDAFLQVAWDQLGEILKANAILRNSQLGVELITKFMDRHVTSGTASAYLLLASPLVKRVLCGGTPIWRMIDDSYLTTSLIDPAFRKLLRPRGRVARKVKAGAPSTNGDLLDRAGSGSITAAQPKAIANKKARGSAAIPDSDLNSNNLSQYWSNMPTWRRSDPVLSTSLLPDFQGADPYEGIQFLEGIIDLYDNMDQPVPEPSPKNPFTPTDATNCLDATLDFPALFRRRNRTKIGTAAQIDAIVPIMAAPDFTEPMYQKLMAKSQDYILPGIDKLPNDTISILETNQPFIESFMVGLNDEMGRELLWNEYPTDQRGSYFRQFWNTRGHIDTQGLSPEALAEKLKDIDYIHRWTRFSHLGEHNNRAANPGDASLVLVVRGELMNRFPDVVFYALRGVWNNNEREIASPEERRDPLFIARIEPDITFFGFGLTVNEAKGDNTDGGWFFAIKENPTGPRFGLDVEPDSGAGSISSWDDVNWGHMNGASYVDADENLSLPFQSGTPGTGSDNNPGLNWGDNAADMAYITYQVPFFMAIHAVEMLNAV